MNTSLLISLLISAGVLGLVILRNAKPRRLHIQLLLVRPVLIALAASSYFIFVAPPVSVIYGLGLIVFILAGVGVGWQRGKLTHIEVEPSSNNLMMRTSPLGIVVILGFFGFRFILKGLAGLGGSRLPVTPEQLVGWVLALGVGYVLAQQTEIWIRAKRIAAESKDIPGIVVSDAG